jgi:hypothetical protein
MKLTLFLVFRRKEAKKRENENAPIYFFVTNTFKIDHGGASMLGM